MGSVYVCRAAPYTTMAVGVDALLCAFVAVSLVSFMAFYSCKRHRCNSEFGDQMHCISGIILCHKPFFGFLLHGVGGMVLLAAGLRVGGGDELPLLMLAMMYVSLSGVIHFDVRNYKPVHFTSLAGVLAFSVVFVWLQCDAVTWLVYLVVSAVFVLLILFNVACTRWKWPWMNCQALVEIVWVLCLIWCMMTYCVSGLQPDSWA